MNGVVEQRLMKIYMKSATVTQDYMPQRRYSWHIRDSVCLFIFLWQSNFYEKIVFPY